MPKGPEIIATIGADASGFSSAMGSVTSSAGAAGGAVLGLKGKLGILGAAVGVLGVGLAVKGFANFIKDATMTFIMFEDQMVRTQAIAGASAEEYIILEESIRDVAAGSMFTASMVAEMGEVLALAGLSVDEMRSSVDELDTTAGNAIKNMVDFAVVAGTDAETAAGIGIAAVKAFRLEITDLERVTSVLTNTFTSSFVNLQQLGDSMRFFAPVAAAAGVSVAEAAAAVGALGNAGLQGSMAGTGLRQALLKVISPSDDARRTIDRLGLSLVTLTVSGEAANLGLTATMRSIQELEGELESVTRDLEMLNRELTDMGDTQERNSIAIGRIRQRALRMGRDLTRAEIKQIERLDAANQDLSLTQRELALEGNVMKRSQEGITDSLDEQGSQYRRLKTIVESQTTGVTSLAEILDQLNESGATTAEILEIFAIRGGGAVLALMAQADAFKEMADANQLAFDGVTETNSVVKDFVGILTGSTFYAMQVTKSKFEELLLVIGEPFGLLMKQEDGILSVLNMAIDKAAGLGDVWIDIADSLQEHVLPAIREALRPENVEKFMDALKALPSIIQGAGVFLQKAVTIIEPTLDKLIEIGNFMGWTGDAEQMAKTGPDRDFRLLGASGESRMNSLGDIAKMGAAGGVAGAIGGPLAPVTVPVGIAAGLGVGLGTEVAQAAFSSDGILAALADGVGDTIDFLTGWSPTEEGGEIAMAEGGIITRPMKVLAGEAGREAIIPLDRFFTKDNSSSETVINLTLESVSIGSGNAVTAGDVRRIMENDMPNIIRTSLRRGARGVL
jgi:TP901 family phage tail tape measure protein